MLRYIQGKAISMQFWCSTAIKGTVSRDFYPWFFSHQNISSWSLIHGLNEFWTLIRIRREIRDNRLKSSASAVSMRPLKPDQNFSIYTPSSLELILKSLASVVSMSVFSAFNEATEADSVISMRPRKRLPWFQLDRWSGFRGINEAVIVTIENVNIKGELQQKSRLIGTTEADFDDFRIEFLGEFKAICETALARESIPFDSMQHCNKRNSLKEIWYTFLVSFESLEVSTPFLFYRFLKISLFSYRIFEYTTFSGVFLSSHNAANELCYVGQFVNRIVN
jgi:hypothetical protein